MQLSKSHKDNLKSQLSWHVLDFEMNLNYLVKAMNSENKTGKPKLESFFFFPKIQECLFDSWGWGHKLSSYSHCTHVLPIIVTTAFKKCSSTD